MHSTYNKAMIIRTLIITVHDLLAVAISWLFACKLFAILKSEIFDVDLYFEFLPILVIAHGVQFQLFSIHLDLWSFISITNFKRITSAVLLGTISAVALMHFRFLEKRVPVELLSFNAMILVLFLCIVRVSYQIWKIRLRGRPTTSEEEPVIVIGAGQAAAALLRDWSNAKIGYVVGLLDDDLTKRGRTLCGVKIVGPISEIGSWAKKYQTKRALVAMPSASPEQKRRAIELAHNAGLEVFSVPSLAEILAGRDSVGSVHKIALEDLLGRGSLCLVSNQLFELIENKTVFVTGAGGSIGSELCRQIARYRPEMLICFDISEFGLYNIQQEFEKAFRSVNIVYMVGDVKDNSRLEQLMLRYKPQLVFHAAAYKHVPLLEQDNAWAAAQNNIFGTLCVALASANHCVQKFVLVSTDKAVNPTNVMGATKRMAELCCESVRKSSRTQFVSVRFGNVLGSSGSVIPKFREQIANGGPITVTHPEIERFFMLIPEAAQLILQAALMGKGGEIFTLDMGKPVRIVDLARNLIRLSGLNEEIIKIEYTGLRPGEKLHEELFAEDEIIHPTQHPGIFLAKPTNLLDNVNLDELQRWLTGSIQSDNQVKQVLRSLVKDYQPQFYRLQGSYNE